jgi:beta-barrel assembly-enhancing protease
MRTRFLAFILSGIFLCAHDRMGADTHADALGAALAEQVRHETSALDDLFVRDYIRELGHQLAKRLPDERRSWDFEVIRENQGGSTHEPIAIPGGHIFVPAPLMLAVENEAELAGMLAHSMAHLAAGAGLGCASAAATARGTNLLVSSPNIETLRTCELEADQTAVKTAAAAGYDPIGLLEYIRRTQPATTESSNAYSTLPTRADRITALEGELADLPTGGRWSSSEFAAVQEKVRQLTAPPSVAPKNPPTLFREDEQ